MRKSAVAVQVIKMQPSDVGARLRIRCVIFHMIDVCVFVFIYVF